MKYLLLFCFMTAFSAAAAAALPAGLTKVEFKTITCDTESKAPAPSTRDIIAAPDDMNGVKIDCSPQDIQTYPFLKDLTKDQIGKGDSYTFNIARIEDTASGKPYLLVNMRNAMIYSDWGSTGAYSIQKDGSYFPAWNVGNGTTVYTLSCPQEFSFILSSNSAKAFSQWTYNGQEILHTGDYDKIDNIPSCK